MRSASYILFSTSHRAPRFLASFPTRRSSDLQVTTGGSDPRVMTPGVQLNMVTKRGTNDFRGSGRYFYTPGGYQADATVPKEAAPYLAQANAIKFVRDFGGEVGGPIWRDRLWFGAADAEN